MFLLIALFMPSENLDTCVMAGLALLACFPFLLACFPLDVAILAEGDDPLNWNTSISLMVYDP